MYKKEKEKTKSYILWVFVCVVILALVVFYVLDKKHLGVKSKTEMDYTTVILDQYTRVDSTLYLDDSEINYYLTVKMSDEFVYTDSIKNKVREQLIASIRKDGSLYQYIKAKTTFRYIYLDSYGNLLFKETITSDMYHN